MICSQHLGHFATEISSTFKSVLLLWGFFFQSRKTGGWTALGELGKQPGDFCMTSASWGHAILGHCYSMQVSLTQLSQKWVLEQNFLWWTPVFLMSARSIVGSEFQALEGKGNYFSWKTLMVDQRKRIRFKNQSTKGFPWGKKNCEKWLG